MEILCITSLYCDIFLPEYREKALINQVRISRFPNTPANIYPLFGVCVAYEKYTVTNIISTRYMISFFKPTFFFNFEQC